MMAELASGRRVNSIVVKNLPSDCSESQLEELFSKFGRVLSSKVLPANANFDGVCGFVNFADPESCNQAVELMDNTNVNGSLLRVSHSMSRINGNYSTNSFDRSSNGFRANGDSHSRTTSSLDGSQGAASPNRLQRFANFRSGSDRSSIGTMQSKAESSRSISQELENTATSKPLWNSQSETPKSQSPLRPDIIPTINEHEPLVKNYKYHVYLSNLEVPNVIFAAALDDYVNATMLINEMNKHEQLNKVQANGYKTKFTVGRYCAALFGGDWYRARILEIDEQRTLVQYIDWGNTNWCDSILEIRPLPTEFYKYPVLCVKCILEGVPAAKPTDEQTNTILNTLLVLDTKLEMTVVRLENGIAHVQLVWGEKNLNQAIRALFTATPAAPEPMRFEDCKPSVDRSTVYHVQLTTVDPDGECFHVLLLGDPLVTILNVMKDWNATKQPLKGSPKANSLICAKYEDGQWYRGWIESVTDKGYQVYFVDFGNEEVLSMDLLSECPNSLRSIPWQSIQVKLPNIQLSEEERYSLLRDLDTQQLEMKVIGQERDVYIVELFYRGKSITQPILEARQKKAVIKEPIVAPEPTPTKVETRATPTINGNPRSVSLGSPQVMPTTPSPAPVSKPTMVMTPPPPTNGLHEDNLSTLLNEQRRQNRLLEQVIAAINTTNALLAQIVQRSSI